MVTLARTTTPDPIQAFVRLASLTRVYARLESRPTPRRLGSGIAPSSDHAARMITGRSCESSSGRRLRSLGRRCGVVPPPIFAQLPIYSSIGLDSRWCPSPSGPHPTAPCQRPTARPRRGPGRCLSRRIRLTSAALHAEEGPERLENAAAGDQRRLRVLKTDERLGFREPSAFRLVSSRFCTSSQTMAGRRSSASRWNLTLFKVMPWA